MFVHTQFVDIYSNKHCMCASIELYFQSTVKSKRDDAKESTMRILHKRGGATSECFLQVITLTLLVIPTS